MTMLPPTARGLLTNTAFALAGDVAAKAGMFLALLVAARVLPTPEFARLGVAMAVVMILVAVLDAGCATVIIRDGASSRRTRHSLLRATVSARLPLALAMIAGAAGWALAFGELGLALVVLACVVANAAQLSVLAVFRSAQTLAVEAIAKLVCGLSYPLAVWAVAALGHRSATALLLALTVLPALSVPGLYVVSFRHTEPGGSRVSKLRIAQRAMPFALMAVSTIAYYRSGTVMLGWLGSVKDTADYTIASTIAFGLLMLPAAVATSLLPRLACETDPSERIRATRLALRSSTAGFAVLACAVGAAAPWAIPFAYGEAFRGAVAPFVILTAAGVLIGACGIVGTLLIALHQSRVLVGQVLLALAVNLAANGALIPAFGAVGAGLATVVTEAVSLALLAVACERVAPGVLLARRGTHVATPAIPPAVTA
ncbi:MAG: hypothetical protein QOJ13_2285 [Gaiellales bacterium]|jgi:O-antigen/teichoic acid export membrane protein|nr:hypothetical protein [Gaiellales bacterium]